MWKIIVPISQTTRTCSVPASRGPEGGFPLDARREGDLGGVERRTPLRASMTPFVLRLFALVSAAMSAPVSARPGNSFLPAPRTGTASSSRRPRAVSGAGPSTTSTASPASPGTLRRWTSQLRSVYNSPATYLPHTRATFQTPSTREPRLRRRASTLPRRRARRLPPRRQRRRLRGDDRRLSPGRRRLLDAFESMGQHARDARDAFVEAALPSAELVAAAETRTPALEVVEGASRNKATPSTTHKILVDPPNADE